jgi:hypothetical protein
MNEIRVTGGGERTRGDDTLMRPGAETAAARTAAPAATDDPGVARAEIEQTRARMSSTIDTIEEVLLRKKEQIQERLDVMAPVREHPLEAAVAVFGAGLVLGLLTGGGGEREIFPHAGAGPAAALEGVDRERRWRARSNSLKARTKALEHTVKEQRREMKRLRAELAAAGMVAARQEHERELPEDERYDEEEGDGGLAATVSAAVGGLFARLFSGEDETQREVEFHGEEGFLGEPYGTARPLVDPALGDDPGLGYDRFPGGADEVHG